MKKFGNTHRSLSDSDLQGLRSRYTRPEILDDFPQRLFGFPKFSNLFNEKSTFFLNIGRLIEKNSYVVLYGREGSGKKHTAKMFCQDYYNAPAYWLDCSSLINLQRCAQVILLSDNFNGKYLSIIDLINDIQKYLSTINESYLLVISGYNLDNDRLVQEIGCSIIYLLDNINCSLDSKIVINSLKRGNTSGANILKETIRLQLGDLPNAFSEISAIRNFEEVLKKIALIHFDLTVFCNLVRALYFKSLYPDNLSDNEKKERNNLIRTLNKRKNNLQNLTSNQKHQFRSSLEILINNLNENHIDHDDLLLKLIAACTAEMLVLFSNSNRDQIYAILGCNVLFDITYAKTLIFDFLTENINFSDDLNTRNEEIRDHKRNINNYFDTMFRCFGLFVYFPKLRRYSLQNRVAYVLMKEIRAEENTALVLAIDALRRIFNSNKKYQTTHLKQLESLSDIYASMAISIYNRRDTLPSPSFKIVRLFADIADYYFNTGHLRDALALYSEVFEYVRTQIFNMSPFKMFSEIEDVASPLVELLNSPEKLNNEKSDDEFTLEDAISYISKSSNLSELTGNKDYKRRELFSYFLVLCIDVLFNYLRVIVHSWEIVSNKQKELARDLYIMTSKLSEEIKRATQITFKNKKFPSFLKQYIRKIRVIQTQIGESDDKRLEIVLPLIESYQLVLVRLQIFDEMQHPYQFSKINILPFDRHKNRARLHSSLDLLFERVKDHTYSGLSIQEQKGFIFLPENKIGSLKERYYPKIDVYMSAVVPYPSIFISLLTYIAETYATLALTVKLEHHQEGYLLSAHDFFTIALLILENHEEYIINNNKNNIFKRAMLNCFFAELLLEIDYYHKNIKISSESSKLKTNRKQDLHLYLIQAINKLHQSLYDLTAYYSSLFVYKPNYFGCDVYATLEYARVLYRLSQAYFYSKQYDFAFLFINLSKKISSEIESQNLSWKNAINEHTAVIYSKISKKKYQKKVQLNLEEKPPVTNNNLAKIYYNQNQYDVLLQDNNFANNFLAMAFIFVQIGQPEKALPYIWRFLTIRTLNAQIDIRTSYALLAVKSLFSEETLKGSPIQRELSDSFKITFKEVFVKQLEPFALITTGEKTPWAKLKFITQAAVVPAQLIPEGGSLAGGLAGGISGVGSGFNVGGDAGLGIDGIKTADMLEKGGTLITETMIQHSKQRALKMMRLLGNALEDNAQILDEFAQSFYTNYAVQIKFLSKDAINVLIKCCVKRIFEYASKHKGLTVYNIHEFLLLALYQGSGDAILETKQTKVNLKGESLDLDGWTVDGFLRKCGIELSDKTDGKFCTRTDKSIDLHTKYGFRKGTTQEIGLLFNNEYQPYKTKNDATDELKQYIANTAVESHCILF